MASIATFVLNLYAIATWENDDPATLGIYFLYMTAFLMASTVPTQLLFIPAERLTLEVQQRARGLLFGRISRLGMPAAGASALLLLFATAVGATQGMSFSEQIPFLTTAAVATVFSPMQNHARRLLHLAGRSWSAAFVSLIQAAVAAISLAILVATSVAPVWIPMGSLALANIVSISVAWVLARASVDLDPEATERLAATRRHLVFRELAPAGWWLVATGMVSTGNNFVVESAIFAIASPEALALAGAAKTVAQPILVLGNGLRSVLGPHSMEAARTRRRPAARRVARTFWLLTIAAVAGYTAIAGFAWVGNPLARLVDNAYTVPFLVALTIAANGLNGAAFPGRLELIGAGKEKQLFSSEMFANAGQLVVAVGAAIAAGASAAAGAFARPIAFSVLGLVRLFAYDRYLDRYYAGGNEAEGTPSTLPAAPDTLPTPD